MENNSNDYSLFKPYICDALIRNPVAQLVNRPPLSSNERIAFPHPNSIKRATLLADRIYLPCWSSQFYGIPIELTYGNLQIDQQTANGACCKDLTSSFISSQRCKSRYFRFDSESFRKSKICFHAKSFSITIGMLFSVA